MHYVELYSNYENVKRVEKVDIWFDNKLIHFEGVKPTGYNIFLVIVDALSLVVHSQLH